MVKICLRNLGRVVVVKVIRILSLKIYNKTITLMHLKFVNLEGSAIILKRIRIEMTMKSNILLSRENEHKIN